MPKSEQELPLRYLPEWRKTMGPKMTQKRLARCMGVTQGFISQVEKGQNTMSLENASRAAKCLGIELADLLREPTPRERTDTREAAGEERRAEAIKLLQAMSGDTLTAAYVLIKLLGNATDQSATSSNAIEDDLRRPLQQFGGDNGNR